MILMEVHFKAPLPLNTTIRLLRKDKTLPAVGIPIGEYSPSEGWIGFFQFVMEGFRMRITRNTEFNTKFSIDKMYTG